MASKKSSQGKSSLAPNLDAGSWKPASKLGGKVNLFQALGFKTSGTGYKPTQLTADELAPAVAAAQQGQNQNQGGSNSGGGNQNVKSTGGNPISRSAVANKTLGQQLAASYGWSTGSEWTALNNLIMSESGWDNNAQNPTSTAYGIGQFLDSTWASVGGSKTSNPTTQIKLTYKYIKQRYGDPIKAWNFHLAHNWY